jgi:formylglycine-generating enzyme required for sulfatase activity
MSDIVRIEEIFKKAYEFFQDGKYLEALNLYDEVTQLNPASHEAWFNKAVICEKINDKVRAIENYLKAVYILPTDLKATRGLGVLYFQQNQFGKARYWLEKLVNWGQADKNLAIMHDICMEDEGLSQNVFISHSSKNKTLINGYILPVLKEAEIQYFIDQSDIPQVENLPELRWQIEQGLAMSDIVLVIWSKEAGNSHWVQVEISSAVGMLKNIILLSLDDTPIPIVLQQALMLGKIGLLYYKSTSCLKDLITSIRKLKNHFKQVLQTNSEVHDKVNLYFGTEFQWVELTGYPLPDFSIGKYPVSQRQWSAVMDGNPSCYPGDDTRPVENISWEDVQEFIARINRQSGQKIRLPYDFEWEFACRSGSLGNWCFGDDEDKLPEYAWFVDNTAQNYMISGSGNEPQIVYRTDGDTMKSIQIVISPYCTNSVFTKTPNRWGIYHMHGNVSEWCLDDSKLRVGEKSIRGGSFKNAPRALRCASHGSFLSGQKSCDIGFRLCKITGKL